MKMILFLMILLFSLGFQGCADQSFRGEGNSVNQRFQSDDEETTDDPVEPSRRIQAPLTIARGGRLQIKSGLAVESVIGQNINARKRSKAGVEVLIGYPNLQSSFAYEE